MKFRNIAVGIVVVGIIFTAAVAAVAWQNGWSIRETVELGAGVIASKASQHTIADRTAAGVPLAIHNIGSGTQEEDVLFAYPLTGHYRIP